MKIVSVYKCMEWIYANPKLIMYIDINANNFGNTRSKKKIAVKDCLFNEGWCILKSTPTTCAIDIPKIQTIRQLNIEMIEQPLLKENVLHPVWLHDYL